MGGMPISELVGGGGVITAVAAGFGYYLNFLLRRRSQTTETESGIVETTRTTLELVRQQRDLMVEDFQGQLRHKDEQIAELKEENRELRDRLDRIEARFDKEG